MLGPGNVIIVSGMAPIFGVHQSLGHQHWKPEQERRMLTVILQTHTKMSFIHDNPWKFPETHRRICKRQGPKEGKSSTRNSLVFFFFLMFTCPLILGIAWRIQVAEQNYLKIG